MAGNPYGDTSGATWVQRFSVGFKRFQTQAGGELPDLMKELFRVLVEKAYHYTPPPTAGASSGGQDAGIRMVRKDICSAIKQISPEWMRVLYERFGPGPISGVEWRTKKGNIWRIDNVVLNRSGSIDQQEKFHQGRRNNRGRVTGGGASSSGAFDSVMLVPKPYRDDYYGIVINRVGKLKAGWSTALSAVGSKLPNAWSASAGKWVRASGAASGTYDDSNFYPDTWSGYLEGKNTTPYFRDLDGFMDRVHKEVEGFVLKKRFEDWITAMIKKHTQVK